MTRAEAEAHVRAVSRRCKGPVIVPIQTQQMFFDWLAAGRPAAALWAIFTASAASVHPRLGAYALSRLAARGNTYEALIDALRAHGEDVGEPCGADFNETILANPLDGREYEYACPHCGVQGTYRAPLFSVT